MVNHENIIKCFDYFEEGGALFLVLELAEEGDMQGYWVEIVDISLSCNGYG